MKPRVPRERKLLIESILAEPARMRRQRWWLLILVVLALLGLAGYFCLLHWLRMPAGPELPTPSCMPGSESGRNPRAQSAAFDAGAAALPRALCVPPHGATLAGDLPRADLERLLYAILQVERPRPGQPPAGDNGQAIGPLQIHRAYWVDAGLPGDYQDCRRLAYARQVVLAYWRRHAPEALAAGALEVLARMHNGGPHGATRAATLQYWRRVRGVLHEMDCGSRGLVSTGAGPGAQTPLGAAWSNRPLPGPADIEGGRR